jgi:hypothetical protein
MRQEPTNCVRISSSDSFAGLEAFGFWPRADGNIAIGQNRRRAHRVLKESGWNRMEGSWVRG